MAGKDKRTTRRAPVVLRIKLRYPDVDTFVERFATNIGTGGMFIASRSPKPPGTQLKFSLMLADESQLVAGTGVVRWVREYDPERPRRPHGMGIEFIDLAGGSQTMIDRVVAHRSEQGLETDEIPLAEKSRGARPPQPAETGDDRQSAETANSPAAAPATAGKAAPAEPPAEAKSTTAAADAQTPDTAKAQEEDDQDPGTEAQAPAESQAQVAQAPADSQPPATEAQQAPTDTNEPAQAQAAADLAEAGLAEAPPAEPPSAEPPPAEHAAPEAPPSPMQAESDAGTNGATAPPEPATAKVAEVAADRPATDPSETEPTAVAAAPAAAPPRAPAPAPAKPHTGRRRFREDTALEELLGSKKAANVTAAVARARQLVGRRRSSEVDSLLQTLATGSTSQPAAPAAAPRPQAPIAAPHSQATPATPAADEKAVATAPPQTAPAAPAPEKPPIATAPPHAASPAPAPEEAPSATAARQTSRVAPAPEPAVPAQQASAPRVAPARATTAPVPTVAAEPAETIADAPSGAPPSAAIDEISEIGDAIAGSISRNGAQATNKVQPSQRPATPARPLPGVAAHPAVEVPTQAAGPTEASAPLGPGDRDINIDLDIATTPLGDADPTFGEGTAADGIAAALADSSLELDPASDGDDVSTALGFAFADEFADTSAGAQPLDAFDSEDTPAEAGHPPAGNGATAPPSAADGGGHTDAPMAAVSDVLSNTPNPHSDADALAMSGLQFDDVDTVGVDDGLADSPFGTPVSADALLHDAEDLILSSADALSALDESTDVNQAIPAAPEDDLDLALAALDDIQFDENLELLDDNLLEVIDEEYLEAEGAAVDLDAPTHIQTTPLRREDLAPPQIAAVDLDAPTQLQATPLRREDLAPPQGAAATELAVEPTPEPEPEVKKKGLFKRLFGSDKSN